MSTYTAESRRIPSTWCPDFKLLGSSMYHPYLTNRDGEWSWSPSLLSGTCGVEFKQGPLLRGLRKLNAHMCSAEQCFSVSGWELQMRYNRIMKVCYIYTVVATVISGTVRECPMYVFSKALSWLSAFPRTSLYTLSQVRDLFILCSINDVRKWYLGHLMRIMI